MNTGSLNLKDWRQSKGISLETIAASTKLSVRQLRAIETGAFRELPGGIYTISYIRQYARAIDFDESRLLAHYQESCRAASKDQNQTRPGTLSAALAQI
jgi:cytoskeletal protein RodZ